MVHDMDCTEAPRPLVVELDNNVQLKGDYRTLQREGATRAPSSLRFFTKPAEFQWPDIDPIDVSPPLSQGRVDQVRLDLGKSKV